MASLRKKLQVKGSLFLALSNLGRRGGLMLFLYDEEVGARDFRGFRPRASGSQGVALAPSRFSDLVLLGLWDPMEWQKASPRHNAPRLQPSTRELVR